MKKNVMFLVVILYLASVPLLRAGGLKPGDVFPQFTARALDDRMVTVPQDVTPKVMMIAIAFTRHDTAVTVAWTDAFTARYRDNTKVDYIQAAMIPDMPFISGIIANAIRDSMAKERWGNFLIYSGDKNAMVKTFSADDQSLFYVYVIGKDGKIKFVLKADKLAGKNMDEIFEAIEKELKNP